MDKQFIPYRLAVKLKELGFDKEVFNTYNIKTKELTCVDDYLTFGRVVDNDVTIAAPLWQQAFDWFRYKKGFESFIRFTQGYGNKSHSYHICDVFRISGESIYLGEGKTYEEARQACLEELIKLTKIFNNDNIRSIKN